MEIIYLYGNIDKDRECIFEKIKNTDCVFVLDSPIELYNYIDNLKLSDNILFKMKICKEIHNINVDYYIGDTEMHFVKFSELLAMLNTSCVSYVTVKGDSKIDEEKYNASRTQMNGIVQQLSSKEKKASARIQLSDIVQQFIYLDIPLKLVKVMTDKEYKDIEFVKKLEDTVSVHESNIKQSIKMLDSEAFDEYLDVKSSVLSSLCNIEKKLKEAESDELKITVAALKKSGKSVIVNSIIERELAPENLQSNCIYKSSDGNYNITCRKKTQKFSNEEEARQHIEHLFGNVDYDIPDDDIYVEYNPLTEELSHYTICDTPGIDSPELSSRSEKARRAADNADVIVFSMDYSRYIEDKELFYLQSIREICQRKNKCCSLVINVNKIDLRYASKGDKSCIRILDFIRTKFISIAPEFRDSIVIGTSALTYFNCIKAVKIKGCENLKYTSSFRNDLEECIDKYMGQNEMSILNFLSKMTSNMKNFHGIKIRNIEELKRFSGMPNLLNYVKYITMDKVRTERINNLINYIENEYKCIIRQNFSSLDKLQSELSSNQESLERSKKILNRFSDSLNNIYDSKYSDINQMSVNGECSSLILKNTGNRIPFSPKDIADWYNIEYIDKTLENNKIIDYVASEIIKEEFGKKIDELFELSERYKKIYGTKKKIITGNEICSCFYNTVNEINVIISNHLDNQFYSLWEELLKEQGAIQEDLKIIFQRRISRLQAETENCIRELNGKCDISFEIQPPSFEFEFNKELDEVMQFDINININALFNRIISIINEKNNNKNSLVSGIKSLINKFLNIFGLSFGRGENVNRIYYDKEYILKELYDNNIRYEIKSYIDRANIENAYMDEKNNIKLQLDDFIEYIEAEISNQRNLAVEIENKVKLAVDRIPDMENYINALNEKIKYTKLVIDCIESFYSKWKEKMNL